MHIKNSLIYILTLFISFSGNYSISQDMDFPEDKVHYIIKSKQNGCELTIFAEIEIEDQWHINAANLPAESFSIPTDILIDTSYKYRIEDTIYEPKSHYVYDEIAKEDLYLHDGKITISKKIFIQTKDNFTLKGFFTFQTCDDNHCLPPYDGEFEVKVNGCDYKEEYVTPKSFKEGFSDIENKSKEKINSEKNKTNDQLKVLENNEGKAGKKSLLLIFFLSFLSGFAALLTPCVFPMIPMTVSFFTKQSQNKTAGIRNAILYGISIIIIYVFLGTIITAIFGASFLNSLSTNVYFNIFFFVLLVVFAISFLGAFDINLPNS